MNLHDQQLSVQVTDGSIFQYYWEKQYYLQDNSIFARLDQPLFDWKIHLGTNCERFSQSGFLYDLNVLFNIEEFVSIEKKTAENHYCFRFFTRHNRLFFVNKLINHLPVIKCFMNAILDKFGSHLQDQHKRIYLDMN